MMEFLNASAREFGFTGEISITIQAAGSLRCLADREHFFG